MLDGFRLLAPCVGPQAASKTAASGLAIGSALFTAMLSLCRILHKALSHVSNVGERSSNQNEVARIVNPQNLVPDSFSF